jgi:ferritin-like metal-binding protein YciE
VIARYLEDAIAAEKSFESQLVGFSDEAEEDAVKALFRQHAEETKRQYTVLTQRLESP